MPEFKLSREVFRPKPESSAELSQEKKERSKEIIKKQREFLEEDGIVYDPEFVKLEQELQKLDPEISTVVFDWDGTLRDRFTPEIRPGALELIKFLKGARVRVVGWTSALRKSAKMTPDIYEAFDCLITRENYCDEYLDVARKGLLGQLLDSPNSALARSVEFHESWKFIEELNWDLLIDDDEMEIQKAQKRAVKAIKVNTYDLKYFKDVDSKVAKKAIQPITSDFGKQILEALNYKESKENR